MRSRPVLPGAAGAALALLLTTPAAAAESFDAALAWARRVELGLPGHGVVAEVAVEEGEQVAAGALLLRLDPRLPRARVARHEALLARLQPALREARLELERAQELYDRTLLAEHELETARIALARAEGEAAAARAELAEARLLLEETELRAPFHARVVRRLVQPGQVVASRLRAEPLLVVADAATLEAWAPVDIDALKRFTVGMALEVEVDGRRHAARVTRLGLEPEAGDGPPRYRVVAAFAAPGDGLRAGQPARLWLP